MNPVLLRAFGAGILGWVAISSFEAHAGDDAVSTSTPTPTDSRETEMFGSETSAQSRSAATEVEPASKSDLEPTGLKTPSDPLALGALLWLRFGYSWIDAEYPETFPFSSPSFLDVYLDGRPNDRIRAYARGRVQYDATLGANARDMLGRPRSALSVDLDQLWLKFDVERTVFLTLGKERIKWGAGRFFNPTDFLNQDVLDPLSGVVVFDERLGIPLIKAHFPIESLGWNFYAIGTTEGAAAPERIGGALRAEVLVGQTEVAGTVHVKKDQPTRLGVSASSGVWLFDLKADAAFERGSRRTFVRGTCRPNGLLDRIERGDLTLDELSRLPTEGASAFSELGETYSRRDAWIFQGAVGAEIGVNYSDDDRFYIGAEYFMNDGGYSDKDLYSCLMAHREFVPFRLGRHYVGVYVWLPAPARFDDTNIVLSGLSNLSDQSGIVRLDYRVRILTYLDINAFVNVHFGESGGEFSLATSIRPLVLPATLPNDLLERVRAELERDPFLSVLQGGLNIVRPVAEVGVGLSLNF